MCAFCGGYLHCRDGKACRRIAAVRTARRLLAIREPVRQLELFDEHNAPFPVLRAAAPAGGVLPNKLFALVTTLEDDDGGAIVRWLRERCGDREQVPRRCPAFPTAVGPAASGARAGPSREGRVRARAVW